MRKIIAIDFDGCLVKSQWPEIGEPNLDVISRALEEQKNGAALILWTCRTGKYLDHAVDFCKALGLTFDAVNANLPEVIEAYGGSDCRKIVASEYWDDHAIQMPAESMTLEEVAALLYELTGDECACNLNGIDEWLPARCVHSFDGTCPDPGDQLECWRQYINAKRSEKEDD